MTMLLASAGSGSSGGARTVLVIALLLGALEFVLYAFKRVIGGPRGGSEKEIVGVLVLLAAIFIGVLVGTGGKSGLHSHPQQISSRQLTARVERSAIPSQHSGSAKHVIAPSSRGSTG